MNAVFWEGHGFSRAVWGPPRMRASAPEGQAAKAIYEISSTDYQARNERTHMLDELTQQYTTLKTKVHDLREYL
jgi:hypothetical protein